MSKNKKMHVQSVQHCCQIFKFVTFLLPSSSWFHKLPNDSHCDLVVRIPEVGTTSEFRNMQDQQMQIAHNLLLNEILDNKGFCYSIIWKLVTLC